MHQTLSQLSNKPRKQLANLAVGISADEVRRLLPPPAKEKALAAIGAAGADEIKRLVDLGRERGTIRAEGEAWPIEKNGADAATLDGVKSQWMNVTPAMAKKWLDNNFRNRPVNDDTVQAYARDMINGTWVPTHQGVAFNDKDELIDGQHRLLAIKLSGKTIKMMVTFGLPSQIEGSEMTTMDAVDRGRTRSVADQLTIQHGFKNGSITASICASIAGLCYGQRTRRLSVGQTLEIFRAFEKPIEWVILRRSKKHGLKTAGVLAAFAFALATEDDMETPIAGMMELLLDGKGFRRHSPLAYLHVFLTSDEAKLLTRRTDRGLAELILQVIYLETKGVEVTKIEPALDGINHFRSLQEERVNSIAEMFALPNQKETACRR
jgi:hypothetical protein